MRKECKSVTNQSENSENLVVEFYGRHAESFLTILEEVEIFISESVVQGLKYNCS